MPQLVTSITSLVESMPERIDSFNLWVDSLKLDPAIITYINEMSENASQVSEIMLKLAGCPVVIFDKDHVVASSGVSKKEFSERRVSPALEDIIELIKKHYEKIGLKSNFTIIDSDDSLAIIKKILKMLDLKLALYSSTLNISFSKRPYIKTFVMVQ